MCRKSTYIINRHDMQDGNLTYWIFYFHITTKGHCGAKRQYTARSESWQMSEPLRDWCEIRRMQLIGEEPSPSVWGDQPCQTVHAAAQWGGTVALQFVTMQCTTVCLCATGGRWRGRGVVWCISFCLHDRISYVVTKNSWQKVTREM